MSESTLPRTACEEINILNFLFSDLNSTLRILVNSVKVNYSWERLEHSLFIFYSIYFFRKFPDTYDCNSRTKKSRN